VGESASVYPLPLTAEGVTAAWLGAGLRTRNPGVVVDQVEPVLGNPKRPDALIDVNWSLDYLGTWFLDDKLRRNLRYAFARVDPKTLFLEQIILWEYPEDAVRDLSTATRITTLTYNQDGIVHEAIDDAVAEGRAEEAADEALALARELDSLERVQPRVDSWLRVAVGAVSDDPGLEPFGEGPA